MRGVLGRHPVPKRRYLKVQHSTRMQLGWRQLAEITGVPLSIARRPYTLVENLHTPAQDKLKCLSAVHDSHMLYHRAFTAHLLNILSA